MKVSVVIPCYNVEDYIEECVESVLNQTYRPIEIICIDNNSSDSTWKKLEDIHERHPEVIIDKELKTGANAARNKGLSLCTGEWVQFLDADDLLLQDKIEHQTKLIHSMETDISFVAGSHIYRSITGKENSSTPSISNQYISVFTNQCGNTCSNLWNKKSLSDIGGWNEDLKSSQEADLMMRIVLNGGEPVFDKTPKTIIRERESGQISQRNPARKWKQYIEVRLRYLEKLKALKPTVYSENIGLFHDFLIVSVITLYKYDKTQANLFFKEYIKPDWQTQGKYGMSKIKMFLIKLFGLKIAAK